MAERKKDKWKQISAKPERCESDLFWVQYHGSILTISPLMKTNYNYTRRSKTKIIWTVVFTWNSVIEYSFQKLRNSVPRSIGYGKGGMNWELSKTKIVKAKHTEERCVISYISRSCWCCTSHCEKKPVLPVPVFERLAQCVR